MTLDAASLMQPIRYTIDINSGLVTLPMQSQLMKGDKNANRVVVDLKNGDTPVMLTHVTVSGSFIRPPDGASIPLAGSAEENIAIVALRDECYAHEGYCEIHIKLTIGETARTILRLTGHVLAKGTGATVDIDGVIPSIDDIIDQYATMQRVTQETEAARDAAIEAAQKSPYIDVSTNNWFVWDAVNSMYVDTGVRATGPQGPQGANGEGSGTVVTVTVNGETYEADETGDVDLGTIAGGAGGGVSSMTINDDTFTPDANGNVAATIRQIRRGVVYAQPYNDTAVSEYGLQMIDNQDKKSLYLISELNTPDVLHYQATGGSRRALYSEGNPPPYPVRTATLNGESFTPDENGNIDFGTISGGSGGSGGTAADSEKLGGKEPKYYLQPENLLINSDFTNPVNTQGKTSYSGKGYTIDRWSCDMDASQVTVNDGYITIAGGSRFLQTPALDVTGKTVTLAFETLDGKVYCNSANIPSANSSIQYVAVTAIDDIRVRIIVQNTYIPRIQITSYTTDISIKWIALYPGTFTVNNLPPYVPKGYATELIACNIADTGRVHDSDKLGGQAPSYYENKVTSVNGSTGAVTVSQIKRGVTNLQPYNNNAVTEYGLQAYNSQTGKSLYMIIRDAAPNVLRIISANTSQDVYSTLNTPIKTATVTFAFNGESLWHYVKISGVTKASQIISILSINEGFWATGLIYDNTLGILTQFRNSDNVYAYSVEAQVAYMV